MSMHIQAAVAEHLGARLELRDVELEDPRHDEILVRIIASGICHTDISMRDGAIPCPFPVVLGHEGAGIVERVGASVCGLAPGDHVVLSVTSCGRCTSCLKGQSYYCANLHPLNIAGCREDGSTTFTGQSAHIHGAIMRQSSFATHALATERNAIKMPRDVPFELLAPLGCGIQTGAGAILNAMQPEPGSAVAIFGLGGVGMSAVMAAHVAGCATVIGVDMNAERLALAASLGATRTIDASSEDAVEAIRVIYPAGIDYALEASGNPKALHQAIDCLRLAGTCVIAGQPGPGVRIELEVSKLLHTNIHGVMMGESVPQVFLPYLIELYRQGRFPIDRLVETYPLHRINDAISASESGAVIKPVVMMPQDAPALD